MRGHIWDNFSSETYKTLPSVGSITVEDPLDGTPRSFPAPSGGPGYYRTPSLVSLWASAPFFHNNALGRPNAVPDPSAVGRMREFDDAAHKLLWPALREGRASIWRTTKVSYLQIPTPALPGFLRPIAGKEYLKIGPIPAGTPINLLGNIDIDKYLSSSNPATKLKFFNVVRKVKNRLLLVKGQSLVKGRPLTPKEVEAILKPIVPNLLSLNKCPDFVEDRGHYFGTQLPDADKKALIEYLKTF